VADLQTSIERWGPQSQRTSDTAFRRRSKWPVSADILDRAVIGELRELAEPGESGMLQELVDLFLIEAPQRVADLSQCHDDPRQLEFHAHALKSMSLNLGAGRLAEVCNRIEQFAREGALDGIPAALKELDGAFRLTAEGLRWVRDT